MIVGTWNKPVQDNRGVTVWEHATLDSSAYTEEWQFVNFAYKKGARVHNGCGDEMPSIELAKIKVWDHATEISKHIPDHLLRDAHGELVQQRLNREGNPYTIDERFSYLEEKETFASDLPTTKFIEGCLKTADETGAAKVSLFCC